MRFRSTVTIAISLSLFLAEGLLGQTVSAAPAAPASPEAQQQIDIVAKRLCKAEPVVGTRLAVRKKCDTPAQLAAYQRQAREMIENYRQRPCALGTEAGQFSTPMQC